MSLLSNNAGFSCEKAVAVWLDPAGGERNLLAAEDVRDGEARACALCPDQGWDGPGREAGVFWNYCL